MELLQGQRTTMGKIGEDECKGEEEKSRVVFIKKHMTVQNSQNRISKGKIGFSHSNFTDPALLLGMLMSLVGTGPYK